MELRSDLRTRPVLGPFSMPVLLAWLVALVFCVAVFGITGWRLQNAHDLELSESRITTANLARSVSDHAGGIVRESSIVLAGLAERLEAEGVAGAPLERMHRLLVARVGSIPSIHHLVVFSATGDALTTSFEPMPPVNVADRPYFIYHREHTSTDALVGPAVRNRADGHWSLSVSRRFERPGGGFGGVVVSIIDCATFSSFYASLNVGPHGAITLLHANKTIIVRHPEPPDPEYRSKPPARGFMGQDAETGRLTSSVDGVARLYSSRRAEGYPLVASVAFSEADVLVSWHREAWVAFAVCAAVTGVLGTLGWGLVRQIRRGEERKAALERSEQRYRMLAEHSTDVIIQLGPDSRRTYVSPSCERLYGYRPDEMLSGHPRDTTHPDDWPALRGAIEEILRTGQAPPITYRSRGKDGQYFWVEALGQKLDGDLGYVVTIRDATHRKMAELRLLEETAAREAAQAQLAHARRMEALGQLAGGVAHDFNNVLQAVQGGAHLIERRPGDADGVRRVARMVADAAGRGASVTKRLLTFSRRGDLRAEAIDPAALLLGMREMLEHTLGGAVEVQVQLEPGVSWLLADKGQLETVLVNLATNARDAMPDGGVITLRAAMEEGAFGVGPLAAGSPCAARLPTGRYMRLMVSDNGVGMGPEVLAHLGEPFFTTKPQGKGTGLGLAMAKGFAEQSGGGLSVESAPGSGTTVALWLPMSPAPAAASPAAGGEVGGASRGRSARILLVDDDVLVREIIAEQLEESGYDVHPVACGPAALTVLDLEQRIDLMISDFSMPGMDGVAVIREAQRRRKGLPAILLTGFATEAAEQAAQDRPGSSFTLLRKPIEARALVECVSGLLEGHRAD